MVTKIKLVLLSLWFGVMALFSFVVAPAAFKVLPTPWLAGNLVNRVLGVTEIMGIVVGVILLGLLFAAKPQGRAFWLEGITLLLMTLSMLISKFVVSSYMHAMRLQYGETLSTMPLEASSPRATFAFYHRLSEMLMGFSLLATLLLIVALIRRAPESQAVTTA